jgi:hypothetical protein
MTKWLERQEKIMHHANYIVWRSTQMASLAESLTNNILTSHYWEPPDMACTLFPKMTRHPTRKSVRLTEIISSDGYGATNFEAALSRFIVQFQNPKFTRRQIEAASCEVHLPFYSLPIFHKIKFWNEEAHGNTTLDSIHAYPTRIKGDEIIHTSRFDTALVLLQQRSNATSNNGDSPSIKGW